MLLYERHLEQIVERVAARLTDERTAVSQTHEPHLGVFSNIEAAVEAAHSASHHVARLPLDQRSRIVAEMRRTALRNLNLLASTARNETAMGRFEDKVKKNRLVAEKTPGVEALTTAASTGDKGITLDSYAPYGVIGAIIPSTNPTETVINNGIGMFAAGNAVVFNPHPAAARSSLAAISMLNRVIAEGGGPEHSFSAVEEPTIETARTVMQHSDVPFLAVTGSIGVVNAALRSGKKVVAAGPGNPPAVVDESADISKAAHDIIAGGSLDNNIICIAEKVTVVVESVAGRLINEMSGAGAYCASANQIRQLQNLLFDRSPEPGRHTPVRREFVGRDARVLLDAIGTRVEGDPRMIVCDVPADHPFAWSEMLMPVMPLVRVRDTAAAVDYAIAVEGGNRHTASMHSQNISALTEMGRRIGCAVYVKNGPNYAGLGMGGEGITSFTIASRTGDGLTTARTFSRFQRCALVGNYGIV